MADVVLEPVNLNVATPLNLQLDGFYTTTGDTITGFRLTTKPQNGTAFQINWSMYNNVTSTNYGSGFLKLADWNASPETVDGLGYKTLFVDVTNFNLVAGSVVGLKLSTASSGAWSVRAGAVTQRKFDIVAQPVPEPPSMILAATTFVALLIAKYQQNRQVANV